MEIPWKDIKQDPPPDNGTRIVAVDANPIIGTGIVACPAFGLVKERFVTHWCWPHEIPIPSSIPAIEP